MRRIFLITTLLSAGTLLSACGEAPEAPASVTNKPVRTIPVTVTTVQTQQLDMTLNSVGTLESPATPLIAAETNGRVLDIDVDEGDIVEKDMLLAMLDPEGHRIATEEAEAELKRLQALIDNQQRIVKRLQSLDKSQSVSKERLDDAATQLVALKAQEAAAHSRVAATRYRLSKTRIVAPVSGRVERRHVSVGDYVGPGNPLFKIVTLETLRVRLPFPEGVAKQLKPGQKLRLASATDPTQVTEGQISEVRPVVDVGNRALNVIADIPNPGGWLPGASINGEVITDTYPQAVMVPILSVVRRPAGEVVYVLAGDNTVQQRIVKTGRLIDDSVHIVEGLQTGEQIVVDGAAFLTNQATVTIQQAVASQGDAS